MRWDRHTLTEFGGIAALVVVGALLFEDAGAAFVPVIGMVGGVAAMALANHERLKQRIESLETRLAQAEWHGGINRAG
jgi:NO-binding membrane sensor protein with MHYT domain